jgi:hypothetical protein
MDDFLLFVAVGFAAQIVDGAIGMAFGLISTTVLLALGFPPAVASASTHAAEVFITAVSGASHWRFKNIDWRLVGRLAVPGMIGGALGAWLLSSVPGEVATPYVTAYLLVMGCWILYKALRPRVMATTELPKGIPVIGACGGFLDAIGGGGWGPIVATTLIGRGVKPRMVIGSTSLSEFFVTLTITGAFVFTIGVELWPIIAGLILGGALAAPFAALVTAKLPDRAIMILVACVIALLSLRGLVHALS